MQSTKLLLFQQAKNRLRLPIQHSWCSVLVLGKTQNVDQPIVRPCFKYILLWVTQSKKDVNKMEDLQRKTIKVMSEVQTKFQNRGVKPDCIAKCIVTYRDLFCPCGARVSVACAGRIWPTGQVLHMPVLEESLTGIKYI